MSGVVIIDDDEQVCRFLVTAFQIHENSQRRQKNFVVVDCAALPDHLVQSTLFGHIRGAFTGADADRPGLLKLAHNGTLFLDELGELPSQIQKRFLRALQEKKFRPVGGREEIKSDFRLISATNRDLYTMSQEGRFREDLYYRVVALKIELPVLMDRKEDIALIARHQICSRKIRAQRISISDEFLDELMAYEWPGNVRELKNAIDLACSRVLEGETLFEDRRLLLVLPDQSPNTISRALKFRPRFFTGPSDHFDDLCAVIKKTIIIEHR